jgi:hypothetical protein
MGKIESRNGKGFELFNFFPRASNIKSVKSGAIFYNWFSNHSLATLIYMYTNGVTGVHGTIGTCASSTTVTSYSEQLLATGGAWSRLIWSINVSSPKLWITIILIERFLVLRH